MKALLFASLALGLTIAACNAEDSASTEDAITTGPQLNGGDMPPGQYALTFDDGPGPRTEELAHWLGDRGITATFFINGGNAPGRDAALRAIVSRGHILANHTQNHVDMKTQSGGSLFHAVADTDAVIAAHQPNGPWLLRAPFGSWNQRVSDELNGTDMRKYVGSIFWNVGGELTATIAADWACWPNGLSVGECAKRYMNEMSMRGRGIILMHDVHSKTVDMTKEIVERIGAEHFVSLLSAPQIATAVGGAPQPPPPPPGVSGCGDLDFKGQCNGNTLAWCENGARKSVDCRSNGKVCVWESDAKGHNCKAPAPCDGETSFGRCDGDFMIWCDGSGALRKTLCSAPGRGQRCALINSQSGFDCVD